MKPGPRAVLSQTQRRLHPVRRQRVAIMRGDVGGYDARRMRRAWPRNLLILAVVGGGDSIIIADGDRGLSETIEVEL